MKNVKYKVLAADDEYWSRENIRNLISWDEYSFEFLEPACDGEEVLERIPEEKPDIILTDINMPFLSGLELLQKLQTEYPQIITIAVSGYDDFEKVKGVFTSGGLDYLLKPVGKEELIQVLKKALDVLEERENGRKQDEDNLLQEYKMSSFLEDSEYSALLSGKLYGHSMSQPHVSSTATFSEVSTLMVKFYNIAQIGEHYDHDSFQMSWSIKSKLRELMENVNNVIIFNNSSKMSEFLVIGMVDARGMNRLAESIQKEFPEEAYGPLSIVIHQQTSSLDDIGTVYREMISTLVTRPFRRKRCVLFCPTGEGKGVNLSENRDASGLIFSSGKGSESGKVPTLGIDKELVRLLHAGQKSDVEKLIFGTCDFRHCDDGRWSFLDVKQYVGRITGILYSYVREKQPEFMALAEESMDNMDYYMKNLDATSMLASLQILIDGLWSTRTDGNSDSAGSQVAQIRQYIEKAYHENITLTSLAEEYHMDASYLSRVFSQTYGETIITYLTRIRMEQAMELMKDEEKKLETISFLVGYDDYNYFSRVFRKKVGMSPRDYRSKMAEKQEKL